MKSPVNFPLQEQAAEYVLNHLSDSEMAGVERATITNAALRLAVKGFWDAAAAIALTTRQVMPPRNAALRKPKVAKAESEVDDAADTTALLP